MIISYPTSGRKTLPAGTTTINIKSNQVFLPDESIDTLYSSKPIEVAKSVLVYTNEEIDLKLYYEGNPVYVGSVFPTTDCMKIEFDLIEITTTSSTVQLVIQVSDDVDGVPTTSRRISANDVTAIGVGRLTVTAAGIAEPLSTTSVPCKGVIVTAMTNNTSIVVTGGSGVIAALATREGTPLYAGDHDPINATDLDQVYADALVSGEGVTFKYYV